MTHQIRQELMDKIQSCREKDQLQSIRDELMRQDMDKGVREELYRLWYNQYHKCTFGGCWE